MISGARTVDVDLETLQRSTFGYFLNESNPANGLVIDKTAVAWPASIAATGLALACYPVGVERGFISRAAAVERTLVTLRFFWNSRQGPEPDATAWLEAGRWLPRIPMGRLRRGLLWELTRKCPYIASGLRRAGFGGGWL